MKIPTTYVMLIVDVKSRATQDTIILYLGWELIVSEYIDLHYYVCCINGYAFMNYLIDERFLVSYQSQLLRYDRP